MNEIISDIEKSNNLDEIKDTINDWDVIWGVLLEIKESLREL